MIELRTLQYVQNTDVDSPTASASDTSALVRDLYKRVKNDKHTRAHGKCSSHFRLSTVKLTILLRPSHLTFARCVQQASVTSSFYAAILSCWRRGPEEDIPGEESRPTVSTLRLVPVHPGNRQAHQEVCPLAERSGYGFIKQVSVTLKAFQPFLTLTLILAIIGL